MAGNHAASLTTGAATIAAAVGTVRTGGGAGSVTGFFGGPMGPDTIGRVMQGSGPPFGG
ncbi:hypothetical protein GCM10010207_85980 [Streptomyces atratus]|nr:hypothetical protein GCM10010207_85980 [Streptomyces atratus]